MLLALAASLAIVVQDHTALRAAPRPGATPLTTLSQGEVLEVRDERGGYLKVYDYRRERGGYLRRESVRAIGLTPGDAPELLAVLRFLADSAGSEPLGISYGAAYLKAVPASALTPEPFDRIARMAERLADQASGKGATRADIAVHLEVAEQFGIHMKSFERNGRMQVCYDGELYGRVLSMPAADAEQRARAALGLTRPDCIDPDLGVLLRASLDAQRLELLQAVDERQLSALTRSRLNARRAAVLAAIAYGQARRGQPSAVAAQRALDELLAVHPEALGEERRGEYLDALLRVGAIRWAAAVAAAQAGPLALTTAPGAPGQTCVALARRAATGAPLARRCTYGIVWTASAQPFAQGHALTLAVQPLESWRELWVFHESASGWSIDVISPGTADPDEGYVDFAGFAPGTQRLLLAREVKEHGYFHTRFEEWRLYDLTPVKQASTPELLADFGRWQDPLWRRDTLALH
ncbi:MAG: SH3 domain-containing protein [Steroidobacteraceae bacterium]